MKKIIVTALVATIAAMPVAAAFAGAVRTNVQDTAPIKKHKKPLRGAGPHKQVVQDTAPIKKHKKPLKGAGPHKQVIPPAQQ
jgi:hypothetical protein